MVGNKRIRSEKLRKNQYKEENARSLEMMGVEWGGENKVEHMWK